MNDVHVPVAMVATAGPNEWPAVFSLVNRLLRAGKRVLITTGDEASDLAPGSFVIPLTQEYYARFTGNLALEDLENFARATGVTLRARSDIASLVAVPARLVRVGVYGGGGAPFNHVAVLTECGFPVEFLSDSEVRAGQLENVDVLVMPGGGARSVIGQVEPLGSDGCLAISAFVRAGGMYIGSCAGSYGCIVNFDEFYQACPSQRNMQLLRARPSRGPNPKGGFGFHSPGVGVITLKNQSPDHPVMYGMPTEFPVVHYNGPVLEPFPDNQIEGASEITGLASVSGWAEQFTPSEGFHGEERPSEKIFLQESIEAGRYSVVAGEFGLGRVVAFGSHPEFGFDLPMVMWDQPARMLVNAVMWQSWSTASDHHGLLPEKNGICSLPPGSSLDKVISAVDAVVAAATELQKRPTNPIPPWMSPLYALSTFGLPPQEIWRRSIEDIIRLARESSLLASSLKQRIGGRLPALTTAELRALNYVDRWILEERAAEWGQDLGYQGVVALLTKAEQMCKAAIGHWDVKLATPRGSYDFLDVNPFHLVAGSYMAAIGHVAGAYQLLRAMTAEWSRAECEWSAAEDPSVETTSRFDEALMKH